MNQAVDQDDAEPPDPSRSRSHAGARGQTLEISQITIARSALYFIGALIVVVAIISFVLGWALGRDASISAARSSAPVTLRIHGRVSYVTDRRRAASDSEAVVLAVPADLQPDEKFAIDALRPDEPAPDAAHPSIQGIRSLGGDFARTGPNGDFELKVQGAGSYFVLVLSSHKQRSADRPPTTSQIVEMGRYFKLPTELLGKYDFAWTKRLVRRELTLDHQFGDP